MRYILFTTSTCHKCPAMKDYISEKVTIPGDIMDEKHDKFYAKAKDLEVMNVPTVIIFNESNQEVFRSSEEKELDSFLNQNT